MPSAPDIRLELKPSRWPAWLLLAALGSGTIIWLLMAWPWWLRLAVLVMWWWLAVGAWWRCQRAAGVAGIRWRADGSWHLDLVGASKPLPVDLLDHRTLGPVLALRLATSDRRRRFELGLWPDSADGDELRRLRIRLGRSGGNVNANADSGGSG